MRALRRGDVPAAGSAHGAQTAREEQPGRQWDGIGTGQLQSRGRQGRQLSYSYGLVILPAWQDDERAAHSDRHIHGPQMRGPL